MKLMRILVVVIFATMMLACGSAERQANKSQAELNQQKVKLSKEYENCMKKAGEDKDKQAECEKYLKAAETLK